MGRSWSKSSSCSQTSLSLSRTICCGTSLGPPWPMGTRVKKQWPHTAEPLNYSPGISGPAIT